MNIVAFVEEICDMELLEYQKKFLEVCYEAFKNHKSIHYIPPKESNNLMLERLQSLSMLYTMLENREITAINVNKAVYNLGVNRT